MRGKLKDLTMNRDGTQNITVSVRFDFREKFDQLQDKELDIEIKQHREKRSRNANAYFHVIVNKIAGETGESDEAVKTSSARTALRPKPFHFTESRRPSRAVENSGKAGFPNAK